MDKEKQESIERAIYREKCKYYSPYSGQCYKHSVSTNTFHLNAGCDGKCERMKRYDKKHKHENEQKQS